MQHQPRETSFNSRYSSGRGIEAAWAQDTCSGGLLHLPCTMLPLPFSPCLLEDITSTDVHVVEKQARSQVCTLCHRYLKQNLEGLKCHLRQLYVTSRDGGDLQL